VQGEEGVKLLGICFFNPVVPSPRIAPGWRGFKKEYTEAEKQQCSIDALINGEECEACQ
jgi:hypothetical protein